MRKRRRLVNKIMTMSCAVMVAVSAFFYVSIDVFATESSESLPIVNNTVLSNKSISQTTNLDSGFSKRVGITVGSMRISDSLSDDVVLSNSGIYKVALTSTIDLKYPSTCNWNSVLLLFGNSALYQVNSVSSSNTLSVVSNQVFYLTGERLKQQGNLIFRCDLYKSSDVSGSVTGSISVQVNSVDYLFNTSDGEYQAGYNAGFADGESFGYDNGFELGEQSGYGSGYDAGYQDGFSDSDSYQDGYNAGYDSGFISGQDVGFQSGKSEGYNIGYQAGYNDGYDSGYDDGEADGYEKGYSSGYQKARSEILTLTNSSQAGTSVDKSLTWDNSSSGLYITSGNIFNVGDLEYIDFDESGAYTSFGLGYYLLSPKLLINPSLDAKEYRINYTYQTNFVSSKSYCNWVRPVFGTLSDLYTGNFKMGSNIPTSVNSALTRNVNVETNYSNEPLYVSFLVCFQDATNEAIATFDISGTIDFTCIPYEIVENGNVIDSIEDQTQQQTDELTNGFDSSHGDSVNSDLSAGLSEFQSAEDSLFTTASSGLDDFTFFNFASIPAMVTGMSFVSSIMTSWFNQAGGASGVGIVLSILFSIMLVAMVLGLYRWYQSKGGKD